MGQQSILFEVNGGYALDAVPERKRDDFTFWHVTTLADLAVRAANGLDPLITSNGRGTVVFANSYVWADYHTQNVLTDYGIPRDREEQKAALRSRGVEIPPTAVIVALDPESYPPDSNNLRPIMGASAYGDLFETPDPTVPLTHLDAYSQTGINQMLSQYGVAFPVAH